jgi:uncharacterized membrane protein
VNPLPKLNPSVRATLAVTFTTFLGAFLGYLQVQLESGIPPQNAWMHVVASAVAVGAVAAYHRWQPSPEQIATAVLTIAVAFDMGLAFMSGTACGTVIASPYEAEQAACVEEAGTRAQADACRCRVKAQMGNPCDGGVLDAGKE